MGITIVIAFIQEVCPLPTHTFKIVQSKMEIERYFALQFSYIQSAIIPMIYASICLAPIFKTWMCTFEK